MTSVDSVNPVSFSHVNPVTSTNTLLSSHSDLPPIHWILLLVPMLDSLNLLFLFVELSALRQAHSYLLNFLVSVDTSLPQNGFPWTSKDARQPLSSRLHYLLYNSFVSHYLKSSFSLISYLYIACPPLLEQKIQGSTGFNCLISCSIPSASIGT